MRPPKRIVTLLTASIALDYTVEIAEHEMGGINLKFAVLAQNHAGVTWRRLRELRRGVDSELFSSRVWISDRSRATGDDCATIDIRRVRRGERRRRKTNEPREVPEELRR